MSVAPVAYNPDMSQLQANLPHLLVALVVIAAAVVLSVTHQITGGEAVAMIGTAGGFSLGTAGASTSSTSAAGIVNAASTSGSEVATPTTPAPRIVSQ